MTDDEKTTKYLNIRLTPQQFDALERLRERTQAKTSDTIKVTYKIVFLEALKALEAKYEKLERDKARGR